MPYDVRTMEDTRMPETDPGLYFIFERGIGREGSMTFKYRIVIAFNVK